MKNSEIQKNLEWYLGLFPDEKGNFEILEKQLANNENLTSRKNFNGHITGGAFVINPLKKEVFLIFHNKLQKWLQPGGHFEEWDKNSIENALREAKEEAGFCDLELHPWHSENNFLPIDVETHFIPENPKKWEPSHYHHDFRYIFIAKNPEEKRLQTEEVSDGKWVSYQSDIEGFDGNRVLEKIRCIY